MKNVLQNKIDKRGTKIKIKGGIPKLVDDEKLHLTESSAKSGWDFEIQV